MKKLSNTEAELKKSVAYKKKAYIYCWQLKIAFTKKKQANKSQL